MTAVRAIIAIGIATFFFAVSVPPMFVNPPWPYTGITINEPAKGGLDISVARGSPAYRAGLRSHDTINCLSARDYSELYSAPHVVYVAAPISLCVLRAGAWRNVSLISERRPPAGMAYISPWLAALRALVYLVYLIVGCALVMARPSLMTWLLFIYCLGAAPLTAVEDGASLSAAGFTVLFVLMDISSSAMAGVLALFALVVPERAPPRGWRRVTFVVLAAATLAAAAVTAVGNHWNSYTLPVAPWFSSVLTIVGIIVVIARLATMQRSERARFGWAAFAIIFGILVNSLRTGVVGVFPVSNFVIDVVSFTAAYVTVIMPLALMYAILRRHVIDVRFVLSRGVVYAIITTLVVGLIGIVDWATSAYLHEVRTAMAIDALVTIALGFVLHRTYFWVDRFVDAVLFREKHQAQEYLTRLARTLPFAHSEEAVDNALVFAPYEKLSLTAAALYRQRRDGFAPVCAQGWSLSELPTLAADDDLLRFFMAERGRISIGDLHERIGRQRFAQSNPPAIAIPIFQSNDLTGFALYGLHHDGTRLDPDEEHVLERLCETGAQAYTAVELARYRGANAVIPAMEAL